jgi:hypothetical protein
MIFGVYPVFSRIDTGQTPAMGRLGAGLIPKLAPFRSDATWYLTVS